MSGAGSRVGNSWDSGESNGRQTEHEKEPGFTLSLWRLYYEKSNVWGELLWCFPMMQGKHVGN